MSLEGSQSTGVAPCYNQDFMVQFFLAVLGALRVFFRARGDTALEIVALRQQVAVLKRQRPRAASVLPSNACQCSRECAAQ